MAKYIPNTSLADYAMNLGEAIPLFEGKGFKVIDLREICSKTPHIELFKKGSYIGALFQEEDSCAVSYNSQAHYAQQDLMARVLESNFNRIKGFQPADMRIATKDIVKHDKKMAAANRQYNRSSKRR